MYRCKSEKRDRLAANPDGGGRPRWARSHRRSHTRERCVGGPCAPPPTRTARALAAARSQPHLRKSPAAATRAKANFGACKAANAPHSHSRVGLIEARNLATLGYFISSHRNLPNSSKNPLLVLFRPAVLIQTTTSAARSHGSGAASGDDWAAQDCCPRRWPPATDAARQHGPAAEQVHHACGQPAAHAPPTCLVPY